MYGLYLNIKRNGVWESERLRTDDRLPEKGDTLYHNKTAYTVIEVDENDDETFDVFIGR